MKKAIETKRPRNKHLDLKIREEASNEANIKRRKMQPWNGKDGPDFEVGEPWDGKR